MSRSNKTIEKPATKGKTKNVSEPDEPLPVLEAFLTETYGWPDVTDILAAKYFKNVMEQFSDVADFRARMKEDLAVCYGKKRIPGTPKKLAHKVPPGPIPQASRIIDFDVGINSNSTGDSDVIVVAEVVSETPMKKIQAQSSAFKVSQMTIDAKEVQSPCASICPMNPVIVSTPSRQVAYDQPAESNLSTKPMLKGNASMPASMPASNRAARFNTPLSLHRSTPKLNSIEKKQALQELDQKLETANIRHENFVREQQGRVARDNEQRKRRVDQNLQQKRLEEEHKLEEIRAQQERVKKFEEAQRSPKTTFKDFTPSRIKASSSVQTPSIVKTPGQRAVPQKRQKQAYEEIEELVQLTNEEVHECSEEPVPSKVAEVKQESAYQMTPDKVHQPSTENDYNVIDLSSGDETDNEDNPRKQVPRWAEKDALRANFRNLLKHVGKDEVNVYFGSLKAPKIDVLFANSMKNYGNMTQDTSHWDCS